MLCDDTAAAFAETFDVAVLTLNREKAMGYISVPDVDDIQTAPPWVQVGNGADPDERHGSFTENLQNWKRCPDAG